MEVSLHITDQQYLLALTVRLAEECWDVDRTLDADIFLQLCNF